jgi:hypothetical protein
MMPLKNEHDPLRFRIMAAILDYFKNEVCKLLPEMAECGVEEVGKWELVLLVKPSRDSHPRRFVIKLSEQR